MTEPMNESTEQITLLEQFTTWLNGPDLDAEVTELADAPQEPTP